MFLHHFSDDVVSIVSLNEVELTCILHETFNLVNKCRICVLILLRFFLLYKLRSLRFHGVNLVPKALHLPGHLLLRGNLAIL